MFLHHTFMTKKGHGHASLDRIRGIIYIETLVFENIDIRINLNEKWHLNVMKSP